jgi:predicted short-subunit dehydrogenase-like oxidoreductase (DUF2520 family)
MLRGSSKIVFLGSGNVATQLGFALKSAGHTIEQVYSRTGSSARVLARKLKAIPVSNIENLSTKADLYILAIKDDAMEPFIRKLKLDKKLLVHTSGSLPVTILKKASSDFGVLYPLQTLTKNKSVNFAEIPLCVEGNTKNSEKKILKIARSVSEHVYKVNSEQRKALHLAAVFAGNFSNHMYSIAEKILLKNHLPFELLYPLIMEGSEKIRHSSPSQVQTGPAIRNDKLVMKAHTKMLSSGLAKLYTLISKDICKNKL